jgi:hypothetical protein
MKAWRRYGPLMVLFLTLSACGPFGCSNAPPSDQYCFSSLKQPAALRLNGSASVSQVLTIAGACVAKDQAKLEAPVSMRPDPADSAISVSIRLLADTVTLPVDPADIITVNNCTGTVERQPVFVLEKTISPGALVASTFYSSAPAALQSDYDRIARAAFAAFAKDIGGMAPTILITAPIDAKSQMVVSQQIVWNETFRRGIVTVMQGPGIVIGDLTVQVPVKIDIDAQQTNAKPLAVVPCQS